MYPFPRLGDQAPIFSARSTEMDCSLENFSNQWLFLLFCHNAFDTIATTEILSLKYNINLFSKKNCQPLIITGSSLFSNLAWVHSIYMEKNIEIDLPILEDPTYKIFEAYNCHNYSLKDRSFFIIDTHKKIRWMSHYPESIGMSAKEILRTLAALQNNDHNATLTPVDWQPGEQCIIDTISDRKTMMSIGKQWFYHLQ
ncbi:MULTISPECIES: redoxin domain-containing protein [Acetobacter]|uniref:redoxin domain-containing protein n=1 Tax=Acetobacter TaxID=434 RepID=UPI00376FB943